ncbi:MAG: PQQ-binding-like beta-propeller repeat protein [Planctomycetaceae bacterium]|nr:PQQ-binding-like beta-propeller repeat protein [Planctomycetaceae bacterium]
MRWSSLILVFITCGFGCTGSDTGSLAEPGLLATQAVAAERGSPPVASRESSGNWSAFRGPTGMGISTATNLPTEWSHDNHIVWKTPLPGPGASSPVVWGDRAYLTCYTGYFVPDHPGGSLNDLKRHLLAIDLTTGELLWDKAIAAKLPEEEQIRDHGFAANTPVVNADRVYAFFGKSGVYAFDHAGSEIWHADVGDGTSGWGTAASPVLWQDLLIVNASVESESLIALNKETGEQVWRTGGINEAWNTPVVSKSADEEVEVVVATHGKLKAFSPADGLPQWTCDTDITWYMVPSLVGEGGYLYSLGGRSGISSLAVKTGGKGDITASHRQWTSMKGSNVSSPVLSDGHLYWIHDQHGIAYCADAKTGEIRYEERMPRSGQVYSSALLGDGKIYYLTRTGKTFVVAATPEFQLVATNNLDDGSQFNGSIAVAGTRLLIRSDHFLYCIGG